MPLSPMRASSARADTDACPGALRLHAAADGPLARVRVPGGRMTGAQLAAVHRLATRWGDGHVEVTSRANLQLRALREAPVAELAAQLQAAGLLPCPTHELVRNIAASPLAEALPVRALDEALCADPTLAQLPGRFLFALDSGAGDVAFGADVAALRVGEEVSILFAGVDAGLRVPSGSEVTALLAAAHAFLDERAAQHAAPAGSPVGARPAALLTPDGRAALADRRPSDDLPAMSDPCIPDGPADLHNGPPSLPTPRAADDPDPLRDRRDADDRAAGLSARGGRGGRRPGRVAWRVRELVDGPARVAARTAAALGTRLDVPVDLRLDVPVDLRLDVPVDLRPGRVREPIGVVERADGSVAVAALVPLGRLSDVQLKVLEAADRLIFTPWRGVVLPGLAPQAAEAWIGALAGAGLEVEAGSRWAGVTTCAGRPGCAKSLADVRGDADAVTVAGAGLPVHWVGCERGCGSPADPHVRVEAIESGYEVRSLPASGVNSVGEAGAFVGAASVGETGTSISDTPIGETGTLASPTPVGETGAQASPTPVSETGLRAGPTSVGGVCVLVGVASVGGVGVLVDAARRG